MGENWKRYSDKKRVFKNSAGGSINVLEKHKTSSQALDKNRRLFLLTLAQDLIDDSSPNRFNYCLKEREAATALLKANGLDRFFHLKRKQALKAIKYTVKIVKEGA